MSFDHIVGTTSNSFYVGNLNPTDGYVYYYANVPVFSKPGIKYGMYTGLWEFSHNGVTWEVFNSFTMPSGTLNQVLQHNGADWAATNNVTLPAGATRYYTIAPGGDAIWMYGSDSSMGTGNPGGEIKIIGGPGDTNQVGGPVYVMGGIPGTDASGGLVKVIGGPGDGTGFGGIASLIAGPHTGASSGGYAEVYGGTATSGGFGGYVYIDAGAGTFSNGNVFIASQTTGDVSTENLYLGYFFRSKGKIELTRASSLADSDGYVIIRSHTFYGDPLHTDVDDFELYANYPNEQDRLNAGIRYNPLGYWQLRQTYNNTWETITTSTTPTTNILTVVAVGKPLDLTPNTDGYLLPSFSESSDEKFPAFVPSETCELRNLTATMSDALAAGETVQIIVRLNEADTIMTVTLTDMTPTNLSGTLYIEQDLINTIAVLNGEKITVRFISSALSDAKNVMVNFEVMAP